MSNMNEDFDDMRRDQQKAPSEASGAFVPRQVVASKFKVISRLGAGGMGTVYRVEQLFLKKEFALKTMDHHTGSEVMIQRFQLEAKAAFSLNHPNLVKVHDYGILDNGNPYLVMDYIDGVTFAEYLKAHGPLPIESVAPLFAQACFGLMAAHEHSVVHRDIKPANLMLLNNVGIDTEGSVKLVDFGIAKLVNHEDGEIQALTRTGEIFGSPLYMSPEQCSSGTVDHRSDIYSLGCVLFEMLTGTPPHMGQNALKTMLLHQGGETPTLKEASLGRDFPEPLEHIVAKMLRKHPEQRYQNIGLVAHDLTMFGSENRSKPGAKPHRIAQKPETAVPKLVSMTQAKLYTLFGLTGLVAALIAGSGVYFLNHERAKLAPETKTVSKQPVVNNTEQTTPTGDDFNIAEAKIKAKTKADAKLLEQLPPIQRVDVVTDNNRRQHKYEFPNISLGQIYHLAAPGSDEYSKNAKGTVFVPFNDIIGFKVCGPEAFAMFLSPSIFKKIPGNDFQGLVFTVPNDILSTPAQTDEQQSPELMEKSVATALQNLDGWINVKRMTVGNCSLNKDALVAFNKFKKLESLVLDQCSMNPEDLAKQPFLLKLTDFYTQGCKFDNNPIINKLATSSSLQRLGIDGTISVDNLHKLRRCPQLVSLKMATSHIDDAAIAEICGMKKLQELHLLHMVLSDKQVMMLTKCKWLNEIQLSKESMYGNAAPRIKTMDSRIKLTGL